MPTATDHTAYALAQLADCLSPDSNESPGAKFLLSVQDAANDADVADLTDPGDLCHEIADAAPDVYTHTRWQEFVDLGAYQEECEFGEWDADLTTAAAVALYQIAYRLAAALLEQRTADDEDADDSDD